MVKLALKLLILLTLCGSYAYALPICPPNGQPICFVVNGKTVCIPCI
jgi:hypothetical protein